MDYVLSNDYLAVGITKWGGQLMSVRSKADNVQHIWRADKNVWGYHAPLLFPYTGRIVGGKLICKGKEYPASAQHGLVRNAMFTLADMGEDFVTLETCSNEETLALWPYKFRLQSSYKLTGNMVEHTLKVFNDDEEPMQFGIGYHPAFAIPFDDQHTYKDYVIRFSHVDTPICLSTPGGFLDGSYYSIGSNLTEIPLTEHLFDNDSHCMTGLRSQWMCLMEKDTGRSVECDIAEFPYCLIWSKPGEPQFLCIEPWHSVPDRTDATPDWNAKPAAARIQPGDSWSTTLRMVFRR